MRNMHAGKVIEMCITGEAIQFYARLKTFSCNCSKQFISLLK